MCNMIFYQTKIPQGLILAYQPSWKLSHRLKPLFNPTCTVAKKKMAVTSNDFSNVFAAFWYNDLTHNGKQRANDVWDGQGI